MKLQQGQVIWDVSRVDDREKTRLEFPDLIRFKDVWYCAFREGDEHINHPSGRCRIISSVDGKHWETVQLLTWQGGDLREPKFSITANGDLMLQSCVYFVSQEPRPWEHIHLHYIFDSPATPPNDQEMNVARQSVTWLSSDGKNWGTPYACPSGINTWLWRSTWHNGMGYSVSYCGKDEQGVLYRTRDGKQWRPLKAPFFPTTQYNEAALTFADNDDAWCIARGEEDSLLGHGKAPYYQEWTWQPLKIDWDHTGQYTSLDQFIEGPLRGPNLFRLRNGLLLLGAPVSLKPAAARALSPDLNKFPVLYKLDLEHQTLKALMVYDGKSYMGLAEHDANLWTTYGSTDRSQILLNITPVADL